MMTNYVSNSLMYYLEPGATAMFDRMSAECWHTLSYCCMPWVRVSTNLCFFVNVLFN